MPDRTEATRLPPSLPDGLLLECLLTTLNEDGSVHVAPMGPIVDRNFERVLLRPYAPSRTLDNLQRVGAAVLHITDDVVQIATAAIGRRVAAPSTRPTADGRGVILTDACRWHRLEALSFDLTTLPVQVVCAVVETGRQRDFIGFNRAKHAVIEAAILATRLDFLPHDQVLAQLNALAPAVTKTGGRPEHRAFNLVREYVLQRVGGAQQ